MVVHYPRTVWKNSYAEHKETGKHTKKQKHAEIVKVNENITCGFRLFSSPSSRSLSETSRGTVVQPLWPYTVRLTLAVVMASSPSLVTTDTAHLPPETSNNKEIQLNIS